MPKFRSKETLESSGSDSDQQPAPKKQKKVPPKPEKKAKKPAASGDDNDTMFALSRQRFVNVRDFRGKVLVDIREYYEPDVGDLRPGKKGISLTVDQWRKLVDQIEEINEKIDEMA